MMITKIDHHSTDVTIIEEDNVTTVESIDRLPEKGIRDDNGFNKELMNLIFAMHYLCEDYDNDKSTGATLVSLAMRHVSCDNCAYTLPLHKIKTLYAIIDNCEIKTDKHGEWVSVYTHYFDRKTSSVIVIDPLLFDGQRYIVKDIYIPYGSDGATKMNSIIKRLQLKQPYVA